jgi:hypothetical protein
MSKKNLASPPPTISRDLSEIEDEAFFGSPVIWFLRGSLSFAIVMVVVTTICIWSVDFRKTSLFSTMTGKVESIDSKKTAP